MIRVTRNPPCDANEYKEYSLKINCDDGISPGDVVYSLMKESEMLLEGTGLIWYDIFKLEEKDMIEILAKH